MRFFTSINRSIKIMILSATIDEDEPTFNEFFADISRIRVHETKQRMKKNELRREEFYTDVPITDYNFAYKQGVNKAMQIVYRIRYILNYYDMKRQYGDKAKINPEMEDEKEDRQDLLFFLYVKRGVDMAV